MKIRKAMRIARGRALRISIPGILLDATVGKGVLLRPEWQLLHNTHHQTLIVTFRDRGRRVTKSRDGNR